MNVLDPIPRADFLALVKPSRTELSANIGRKARCCFGTRPARLQNPKTGRCRLASMTRFFSDRLSIVSQGASWAGVALALPGLQLTLRNGLDREDTFAVITVMTKSEFVVGCGTAEELQKAGVIGPPKQMFAMSIPIIVEYMRRRAAEHDITLPRKLAPPPAAMPAWVEKNKEVFGSTHHGSVKVTWSSNEQFSVAALAGSGWPDVYPEPAS